MNSILVVDDEKNIVTELSRTLRLEGHHALTALDGTAALEILSQKHVDLILLDIRMPGMDGVELLKEIRQRYPEVIVIMMSAQDSIETAVQTMELGARRYIVKPAGVTEILEAIEPYLDLARLRSENADLRKQVEAHFDMVGETPVMQQLYARIQRAGPSEGRVLITGENGTGKELAARAIHRLSRRKEKPFVKLNCAAIPEELIESELFGHERGAFTGATNQRRGKFEIADGGTLFLDEVADMSPRAQAKVLRALQEGELERVGSTRVIRVDVRVIAASNKELEQEIEEGRFREDLYYRLNVIPIHVPALRERKGDISLLVRHFARILQQENALAPRGFDSAALRRLRMHDWPGNVRELRNIVERLMIMVEDEVIRVDDVDAALGGRETIASFSVPENLSLKEAVEQAEAEAIRKALEANNWNVSQTARQLQIERSNFYKKLRKHGIQPLRISSP